MAARLAVLVCTALLAVGAGCGGDDESDSATEWADGLCSAMTTWSSEVEAAGDSLQDDPSREGLESTVDDLREATEEFSDDLDDLGRPETESGDQAEAAISLLADNLLSAMQTIDRAVEGASGPTSTLTAISAITTTFATMGQQVSTAFGQLEQVDAGGELEQAFDEADACDEIRSGS